MEDIGETCKLCLKYIQGANFATLDDNLRGKLEFLQMNLDNSVEESNTVCKECEEKIENSFKFKSCIVNPEGDSKKKSITNVTSMATGESSVEKVLCHLCKEMVSAMSVISVSKLPKDDCIMEVFQRHISEIDLKAIEDSMVCGSCQNSLANFSTLIAAWSITSDWNDEDMKEDLDDYEMADVKEEATNESYDSSTNSLCATDASDCVKTVKKMKGKRGKAIAKLKTEFDAISESNEDASRSTKDIKKEANEADEDKKEIEDLQLKHEHEVDIKPDDEQGMARADNGALKRKRRKTRTNQNSPKIFKCDQCSYTTKRKQYLGKHMQLHKSIDEVEQYQCQICSYKTRMKCNMPRHVLIHKDASEVELFKCQECAYVTRHKRHLNSHSVIHKKLNEIPIFNCPICSHFTKTKYKLKEHMLVHNNDDAPIFKCDQCSFTTRRQRNLKQHSLIHKDISEIRMYKCDQCSYMTKKRSRLPEHAIVHKTKFNDDDLFKCDQCSYATPHKRYLKRHYAGHKK